MVDSQDDAGAEILQANDKMGVDDRAQGKARRGARKHGLVK